MPFILSRRFEIWHASKVDETSPEIYGSRSAHERMAEWTPKVPLGDGGTVVEAWALGVMISGMTSRAGECSLLIAWYVIPPLVSQE